MGKTKRNSLFRVRELATSFDQGSNGFGTVRKDKEEGSMGRKILGGEKSKSRSERLGN